MNAREVYAAFHKGFTRGGEPSLRVVKRSPLLYATGIDVPQPGGMILFGVQSSTSFWIPGAAGKMAPYFEHRGPHVISSDYHDRLDMVIAESDFEEWNRAEADMFGPDVPRPREIRPMRDFWLHYRTHDDVAFLGGVHRSTVGDACRASEGQGGARLANVVSGARLAMT